jgi:hypothetical protein
MGMKGDQGDVDELQQEDRKDFDEIEKADIVEGAENKAQDNDDEEERFTKNSTTRNEKTTIFSIKF